MKLVIFDCDGTIADSQHMILAAMERAFEAYNLVPPTRMDVVGVIGLSLDIAIAQLLAEEDRDQVLVDNLTEGYKKAFAVLRSDPAHFEPLYEGAFEAIRSLCAREDVVLGVATGKSRRGLDRLLARENLAQNFVTLQTADDHPSKPHPSMISAAMIEAGAQARDTVMVGDTTFDIEMARAAGVGAIGVAWGYHPVDELSASGAHALVDRFEDLARAVDGVLAIRSEAVG